MGATGDTGATGPTGPTGSTSNFTNTLDYGSSTYSPSFQTLQSSGSAILKKGETAYVVVRAGGEAGNTVDVDPDGNATFFTGVLIG